MLRRNQGSQRVFFALVDALTGTGLTGATVTARVALDAGAQAIAGGTVTELGNGQYRFNPTAGDTDGANVGFLFTATNAIPVGANFITTTADTAGTVDVNVTEWRGAVPNVLQAGRVDAHIGSAANDVITAAVIATAAIDADAIAADAIGASELAADAVAEIQAGLATAAAVAAVQADTDDIQARLPTTLNGGRMRSHVEAMDVGVITAAVIATDAVGADELAASAVAEIQSGLATAAAVAAVQADTDDIQVRLPATLNGGRMRSHVEAMDSGTVTAAVIATDAIDADALAASAVTEIQAGLATAAAIAAIQADTDDLQARVPATLNGGRMRSHVEIVDPGSITAASLAPDASEEILSAASGTADAGSTALTIVDAARTESDIDYWKDMIVLVTSGAASGQARRIATFNPVTDTITVDTAFTQAIVAGDSYLILRTAIAQAGVAGATDWTAGERSQIRQALGVTGGVAATEPTGDLQVVKADADNIQTRLPVDLNPDGRMRSHTEACDPPCTGGGGPADNPWQRLKVDNQGNTIMGNIAEDLDNQEYTVQEG